MANKIQNRKDETMLNMSEKIGYGKEIVLENKRNEKISLVSTGWDLIVCLEDREKVLEKSHLSTEDLIAHNCSVYEHKQGNNISNFSIKRLIIDLVAEGKTFTVIDQGKELKKIVKHIGDKVKKVNIKEGVELYIFNS